MPSAATRAQHSLVLSLLWICEHVTVRAQYGITYREPELECLSDGIRLHIYPVGVFVGHVYVMGHFTGDKCHLNYCRRAIRQPFFMDVSYGGGCNVRRYRSQHPMAVTYEVTVIIQHHPLFITAGDRAYRLNCIYRQIDAIVTQKLNINELPSRPIEGVSTSVCRYDILASMNGPILRIANVGEPVVHKWSCDLRDHGFLVHSCVVRDHLGTEYKLIDERGCVIEKSLVPDVTYSPDLSYAFTTINAFRFAEQIIVHFACQITLCRIRNQGCEGISPPTCYPVDFPPIRAEYRHKTASTTSSPNERLLPKGTVTPPTIGDNAAKVYDDQHPPPATARFHASTPSNIVYETLPLSTKRPVFMPSTQPSDITDVTEENEASIETQDEFGLEISRRTQLPRRTQGYRTETISSVFDLPPDKTLEPMPLPSPANIFYAKNRITRSTHHTSENVTLDVEAKRMLVFSSDDSERIDVTSLNRIHAADGFKCNRIVVGQTILLGAAILLQATSVAVILMQRRIYGRNLRALLSMNLQKY